MKQINIDKTDFVYNHSQLAFWFDFTDLTVNDVHSIVEQLALSSKFNWMQSIHKFDTMHFKLNQGRLKNKHQMLVLDITADEYSKLKELFADKGDEDQSIYSL